MKTWPHLVLLIGTTAGIAWGFWDTYQTTAPYYAARVAPATNGTQKVVAPANSIYIAAVPVAATNSLVTGQR